SDDTAHEAESRAKRAKAHDPAYANATWRAAERRERSLRPTREPRDGRGEAAAHDVPHAAPSRRRARECASTHLAERITEFGTKAKLAQDLDELRERRFGQRSGMPGAQMRDHHRELRVAQSGGDEDPYLAGPADDGVHRGSPAPPTCERGDGMQVSPSDHPDPDEPEEAFER